MKNHPANHNYSRTLSLSSLVSGWGDDNGSVWKKAAMSLLSKSSRRTMPSPRKADREAAAGSVVDWNAASRYDVDAYGRPRILSRLEVILHALAWPAVAGVAIGFGVAIALLVIHNPSTLTPRESAGRQQVASQEAEP